MSSRKPIYMYLAEVKKTNKYDSTHKVALYPDSVDNEIPTWFKKFHEEEFKPLVETVNRMQNEIPAWFKKFHEEEFVPLRDAFIESQSKPPKWFVEFAKKQEEHWAKQEKFNQYVLDVFKRNNLK